MFTSEPCLLTIAMFLYCINLAFSSILIINCFRVWVIVFYIYIFYVAANDSFCLCLFMWKTQLFKFSCKLEIEHSLENVKLQVIAGKMICNSRLLTFYFKLKFKTNNYVVTVISNANILSLMFSGVSTNLSSQYWHCFMHLTLQKLLVTLLALLILINEVECYYRMKFALWLALCLNRVNTVSQ